MKQEHHFVVQEPHDGLRLDQFLASTGVVSRRMARDLLADGSVYLNRRRVKIASRRVRPGDRVKCYFQPSPKQPSPPRLDILYRDRHLVVVAKPAGMPVQGTVETDRGAVVTVLRATLKADNVQPRVVHRLDRPASGALVVALTREAAAGLSELMARHAARRRYLVVVEGTWTGESTLVHYLTPPSRGAGRWGLGRVDVRPFEGEARARERKAVTRVTCLAAASGFSLLSADLETGRTHQVRAQLAFEGFPVVGDVRYGAQNVKTAFPGIALHAWVLEFVHPVTSSKVSVVAPVPAALKAWLEAQALKVPDVEPTTALSAVQRERKDGENRIEETPLAAHGNGQAARG